LVLLLNLGFLLPNKYAIEVIKLKLLNTVSLAAVAAISIGFLGACAEVPAQTTTEYSTTAPGPVYVAPPVTTGSSTTTTQYPNGTVTSTTPVYSRSVVTSPSVVMIPSPGTLGTTRTTVYDHGVVRKQVTTTDYNSYDSTYAPVVPAPVLLTAPPVVQIAPVPSQTTTSTSWDNGATEQKKTTTSVDGSVQNRTTTTWNGNGGEPSQTTTTTSNNP
jgi:hypothetical protein